MHARDYVWRSRPGQSRGELRLVRKRHIQAIILSSVLLAAAFLLGWLVLNLTGVMEASAAPSNNDVLICHQPPPGPFWIWIDESAVEGHLQHGDKVWSEGLACGGQIYEPPGSEDHPDIFLPVIHRSCSPNSTSPFCR